MTPVLPAVREIGQIYGDGFPEEDERQTEDPRKRTAFPRSQKHFIDSASSASVLFYHGKQNESNGLHLYNSDNTL